MVRLNEGPVEPQRAPYLRVKEVSPSPCLRKQDTLRREVTKHRLSALYLVHCKHRGADRGARTARVIRDVQHTSLQSDSLLSASTLQR